MTDQGTEFFNKSFQALLKNEDIQLFNTFNETKASMWKGSCTFKSKMWIFFMAKKTMRYLEMLPDLMYSYKYNHSRHRSIKMKPALANIENEDDVFHTLYDSFFDNVQPVKYKFKVGDKVRISKLKRKFEKSYLPNFSTEIFVVSKRLPRDPPVYKLKNYDGEELKETFHDKELQKVVKDDGVYEVEKILKKTRERK